MILLTAPSKTQGHTPFSSEISYTLPIFQTQANQLTDQLRNLGKNKLAELMKISEALTEKTLEKINTYNPPFTCKNASPALFTFQGDAWNAVSPQNYSREELHWAQHHLRILSGLYGMLRPLDLMQPYRLEMGTKLGIGEAKNLYQFWQNTLTETLRTHLKESGGGPLINLASKEYSRVILLKNSGMEMITLTFRQQHKGKLKTIPIHSKRARGLMLHWAITRRVQDVALFKTFALDGYQYSRDSSSQNEWIFIR